MTLSGIFRPRSVAVVGASPRRDSLGHTLLCNLRAGGFPGHIWPVHPQEREIVGLPAVPSLLDVPGPLDLVLLAVPARFVLGAVRDAAARDVRGIVMITAGFKETGQEGAELQEEVLRILRGAGIRLIGPNCMGLIDTDPAAPLNASFAAVSPRPGRVAFASQSGALGEVVLEMAGTLDIGLSSFVSLGNQADVDVVDLLEHWADDPRTSVVLLYLETIPRPSRFLAAARRLTRDLGKPVVVVKAGRSEAGARAASSHTGSLAGADVAATALLDQAAVVRVETLHELLALAAALAHQPLPRGRRVAIVTNAGGPGILATDAADRAGLRLATLGQGTISTMRDAVLPESSLANPVDLLAPAGAAHYRTCVRALLSDPAVDSLIAVHVAPGITDPAEVARGVVQGAVDAASAKPVLASFMNVYRGDEARGVLRQAGIPCYDLPEPASVAMGAMAALAERMARPPPRARRTGPPVDAARAREVAREALAGARGPHGTWLDFARAAALLEAAGLAVAPWAAIAEPEDGIRFGQRHGWPLVLKTDSPAVLHRTELGAVRTGLRDDAELAQALRELRGMLPAGPEHRVLVQPMVRGAVEVLVGATRDPGLGHLVAFGLGGVAVEVLGDVAFRVAPLSWGDAAAMVRAIRGLPLLQGARGRTPVDLAVLEDVLLRLSELLEAVPEIAELDVNPLMAGAAGAVAVDVRVRLAPAGSGPDPA